MPYSPPVPSPEAIVANLLSPPLDVYSPLSPSTQSAIFTFNATPATPPIGMSPSSSSTGSSVTVMTQTQTQTTQAFSPSFASVASRVPISLRLNLGIHSSNHSIIAPIPVAADTSLRSLNLSTERIMIRKKSGELVKPSLKTSSSFSLSKSAPTSPGTSFATLDSCSSISTVGSMSSLGTIVPSTPSKMVHFDSQLEHVKLFLSEQKPAAVSRDGSPEPTTTDTEGESSGGEYFGFKSRGRTQQLAGGKENDADLARRVTANFVNFTPASSGGMKLLPTQNVRLSSLELRLTSTAAESGQDIACDGPLCPSLDGTILVRNLTFNKWVNVRFTLDEWQTVSEVSTKWMRSVDDVGGTEGEVGDLFGFSIKMSDHLHRIASKTMMFCIRFSVPGSEWWDNNNGANYVVRFSLRDTLAGGPPSSPEPEDLRKRLDKLSREDRPHRPRTLFALKTEPIPARERDDSDDEYVGKKARAMSQTWSANSTNVRTRSSVPFPTGMQQEKEVNTATWLRTQSQQQPPSRHPESHINQSFFFPPAGQVHSRRHHGHDPRKSYTFPKTTSAPDVFESFGPYANPSTRLSPPALPLLNVSFGAFEAGRGSPREFDPHSSELAASGRRATVSGAGTAVTPPSYAVEHMGGEAPADRRPNRRNHARTSYFDSWAGGADKERDSNSSVGRSMSLTPRRSEMENSAVKKTPPGTPLDLIKTVELPQYNPEMDGRSIVNTTAAVAVSHVEFGYEQPLSNSSSNETITLGSGEPEPEPEVENEVIPGTPSLVSNSASSPSDESGEELVIKGIKGHKPRPTLEGLFGPSLITPASEESGSSEEEEEKRRYTAFVDQFCFFTGGKQAFDKAATEGPGPTYTRSPPLDLTPPAIQALNVTSDNASPRRANSDSNVGLFFGGGGNWPPPPPPHTRAGEIKIISQVPGLAVPPV